MAEARSEPSMEDILASIKRIISDDQAPQPARTAPAAPQPVAPRPPQQVMQPPPLPVQRAAEAAPPWPPRPGIQPPESILELTDRAPVPEWLPEAPPPAPPPIRAPEPAPPVQRAVERLRQAEAEMPQPAPRPVPRDLMPRTPTPRPTGGEVTLDALVREMLQPILADWIDRNLPDMVERLVQAEIRRMSDKDG